MNQFIITDCYVFDKMAKIKGMDQVKKLLKDLRKQSEEATQRGILRTAKLIEADAKAHVPKDQGMLEASIGIEQTPETTYIFASALYAAYQEFGTGPLTLAPKGYEAYAREFFVNGKGITPSKPFLFPALFKYQNELLPIVEEEMQKVVTKFNNS